MVINSSLSNLTYVTYRTVHNKKSKPSEETVPFIKQARERWIPVEIRTRIIQRDLAVAHKKYKKRFKIPILSL